MLLLCDDANAGLFTNNRSLKTTMANIITQYFSVRLSDPLFLNNDMLFAVMHTSLDLHKLRLQ